MDTKLLVESYLQRLGATLGNDGLFRAVHRELSADKNITQVEAIEIASRFLEPMAQSATRPKALQKSLQARETVQIRATHPNPLAAQGCLIQSREVRADRCRAPRQ